MAKVKKETKQEMALPLNKELVDLDTSFMNEHLGWEQPEYITQNMVHEFRGYQEEALRYFHYSQVSEVFKPSFPCKL